MSTWREFDRQLNDCDIQTFAAKSITSVVIRGHTIDFDVAACHVEGGTLVIDLGQPR